MNLDIDHAIQSPASAFRDPADVVANRRLTNAQKLRVLKQWEIDARALAVAEEEGMTGGEPSMLQRVMLALDQLDDTRPVERSGAATKHGN